MINWQKPEYTKMEPTWQRIDNACMENDLKEFLADLNPQDETAENKSRNENYKERAVWFGASQITLQGLLGIAFDEAPTLELGGLSYLKENADGQGVDLQSQMQAAVSEVLRKARGGLFVTYPHTDGPVSKAQADRFYSTIHLIEAERIINWWTIRDGASTILGGVVFSDTRETVEDYEVKVTKTLRELALENRVFVDRSWVEKDGWQIQRESQPVDASGKPFLQIPFCFIGSLDNTATIDQPPPMEALVNLNIAHFRNSADYEESVHWAGQAQPYIEGDVNPDELKRAREEGFYIGSRELIIGKFGFAQAAANPESANAMRHKEQLMLAAGARLLESGNVAKTATQAGSEIKIQHSILSLIVANVEDAYQAAGRFAAQYMNTAPPEINLSRGFMKPAVSVEMIDRLVALLDRGLLGPEDALPMFKRCRLIGEEKTMETYVDELEARGVGGALSANDAF